MYRNMIVAIGICLLLLGCDSKASNEVGYGTIENGVYENKYFNMTVKLPAEWVVQSQAAQQEMKEVGASLLAGEDDNLKNVIKEAQKNTISLFTLFKYEQGTPVPFNPSLISLAEGVSGFPGIKNGTDYHFHARKLLESGQLKYDFPNEIYAKDVSGVTFDVMQAQTAVGGTIIYQEYYAAKKMDYVLLFVLTYSSDTERDELNEIMSGAKF
jgi:hypothetical protein